MSRDYYYCVRIYEDFLVDARIVDDENIASNAFEQAYALGLQNFNCELIGEEAYEHRN